MLDIGTVSSDDVITSYKNQLSDAHHKIAMLEAQLVKAAKILKAAEEVAQTGVTEG